MLKKIYYLSTCYTCKKIIQLLDLKSKNFELQDIKQRNISEEELTELKKLVGSYEALFSKIARKYKELNLKDASLTEEQMKHYILNDYTFLKRPVILFDNHIFIGNAKATIENAKNTIKN
jgi:arsenate reductase